MANVHDVATYIAEKLGSVDTLKLQKLVYYSQGWHMAWEGRSLFPEKIQAWANGPVVCELYQCHRGRFTITATDLDCNGSAANLEFAEMESVDAVLESYGKMTGRQLSVMTHNEQPWLEARGGLAPEAKSTNEITPLALAEYFSQIDADSTATPVADLVW